MKKTNKLIIFAFLKDQKLFVTFFHNNSITVFDNY